MDQPEALAIVLFPPAASSSAGIAQLGESSAVGRQPGPGKGACHTGREGTHQSPLESQIPGGNARTSFLEPRPQKKGPGPEGLRMSHTHEEWTESNLNHYQR